MTKLTVKKTKDDIETKHDRQITLYLYKNIVSLKEIS